MRDGDPIEVVDRPDHGVTIGGWFSGLRPEDAQALLDADAAGAIRLQPDLRRHADKALGRAGG